MKQSANQTVYKYLEDLGVLEHGSPEDIENARKQYWRQYRAAWRKAKRAQGREVTICLTKNESTQLSRKAAQFGLTVNQYLKEAALAQSKQEVMAPQESVMRTIHEQLVLNCTAIQHACEDAESAVEIEHRLIEQIAHLENMVMAVLKNAYSIEESVRQAVQNNPEMKLKILNTLKNMQS